MATLLTWQELILGTNSLAMNRDQNAMIPPAILSAAGRLSTDFLLSEIARVFPYSQPLTDMGRPFIKRKLVPVTEGLAIFPDDYRNVLSVSIAVNKDATSGCNCENDEDCHDKIFSRDEVQVEKDRTAVRKEKCYFQKVNILDLDQYDDATQNAFMPPNMKHPIGMFVDRTTFKICPIGDISYVEVRYLKQPLNSTIGFKQMPDDTWQIDTTSPFHVELEWERNAYPQLFRCMCSLLGLHTRDGNFNDWQNALKQVGYF